MLTLSMLFGAFQPPKPASGGPATGPGTKIGSILLWSAGSTGLDFAMAWKLVAIKSASIRSRRLRLTLFSVRLLPLRSKLHKDPEEARSHKGRDWEGEDPGRRDIADG
jgi:hypothetical protein